MSSRRDYEAIAKAIRDNSKGSVVIKSKLVNLLVAYFEDDNENFKEDIFRQACKTSDDVFLQWRGE
jgi:hypothetical protein